MKKLIVVAALVLGSAAVAAAVITTFGSPAWFQGGIYVGSKTSNVGATARNAITFTAESAATAHDFAALAADACADSSSVTVSGAALGDACFLALDQNLSANHPTVQLSCRVTATNTAVVRACANGASLDGGSSDLPDAGYTLRVIR